MDKPTWNKHSPWDGLLDRLKPASADMQTGLVVTAIDHAFSADIFLPRQSASPPSSNLPQTGHYHLADGLRIACLTPHHYLLHADQAPSHNMLETLFGPRHSLIDQSGARATLIVSGPCVQDCLQRGVVIDLDGAVFPPSSFAATYAGHIPIHITALDQGVFELSCPASMAGSFWHWLHETALAFGIARP